MSDPESTTDEPLMVAEVPLVLDHVRTEDFPETILAGLAARVAVGAPVAAVTVTVVVEVAVPPAPVTTSL